MEKTIHYYNHNAETFVSGTVDANMKDQYAFFQKYCKPGSKILDFGCGSGRDAKYFLEQGYRVHACDGSRELCRIASAYAGISVKHMYFYELAAVEEYDGIWACSSLLHVPMKELPDILARIRKALVIGGYLYASFKYGDFSGDRNGRFFTDLTEEHLQLLLADINGLQVMETAVTYDVRADHSNERWLNVMLRRKQ